MSPVRCGGYQGPASVHTQGLQALAAALERQGLAAAIQPDVTADGSTAASLLERVERGDLDLCYFASSYLAARAPALLAFDVPFLFGDRAAAHRAFDGRPGTLATDAIRSRTGFVVLGIWDNGVRHLSCGVRPLRAPQDCAGLVIRTLDNTLHQAVFASFGFRPLVVDVRDLAASVREGRVDAQENPLTNTVNFGLHRTHRFHSLTAHLFGAALVLANRDWHEGLSEAAKEALATAVAEATAEQRRLAAAEDARAMAALLDAGAEVLGADALDLDAFRAACAPVRARALAELGPEMRRALA